MAGYTDRPAYEVGKYPRDPESIELFSTIFLARLSRLVRLRHPAPDRPADAKLLAKATYSTYCDCVAVGVGEEARNVLRAGEEEIRLTALPERLD